MYTLEWLIGTGAAAAVVGALIGWLIARTAYRGKRATDLAAELEQTQEELANYKQEVYEQFGETARKFKNLNDSYADLHKQLATSASVLCADMDTSNLLSGPAASDALEAQAQTVTTEDAQSPEASDDVDAEPATKATTDLDDELNPTDEQQAAATEPATESATSSSADESADESAVETDANKTTNA